MSTLLYQIVSALTAILVFMVWIKPSLFRILRDKDTDWPSGARQGQFTALIVSTWALTTMALRDAGIPEWFGTAYLIAWAGAQFGSVWLKIKGQSQSKDGQRGNF